MPEIRIHAVLASGLGLAVALLTVAPAAAQSDPATQILLGNPSGAVASASYPSNYLLQRPQLAASYHRDNGIPNWVSWHVSTTDLGAAGRCNCFSSDQSLPSGWYRVTSGSYTNSGFDRGHMTPSADRTRTSADNRATFFMTNVLPQAPDNNQGPWARMEDYLRSLVRSGKELYVISGGDESAGTIDGGHVRVPRFTWKVVLVLDAGSNDLARVDTSTRTIAVSIPNRAGVRSNDWRVYRTSVDQVEIWTGYNFFSALPNSIENVIEARVDDL